MEAIINKKKQQPSALLKLKDVEHLVVEPNATSMDILAAAVAAIAKRVHLYPNNYHAPTSTLQQQEEEATLCPKKLYLPPKKSPRALPIHSILDGVVLKSNHDDQPSTSYRVNNWRSEKGKQLQESSYSYQDGFDDDFYCTQRRQSDDSRKVLKRKKREVYCEDGDEEKPQTKKKTKKVTRTCPTVPINNPEQYLSSELKTLILDTKGGKDLKLVVQKELTHSDLSEQLGRFLIPARQTVNEFLTDSEKEGLLKTIFREVNIVEPNNKLRESRIKVSRWEMKNTVLVLNGSWNNLVMENRLAKGMVMQLWAFRVGEELNLAMVNLSNSRNTTSTTSPGTKHSVD